MVPNVHRPEIDSAKEPVHVISITVFPITAWKERVFAPWTKTGSEGDENGRRGGEGDNCTLRVQHLLDGAGDAGGVAADDEFETVARYQRHIGRGRSGHGGV